MKNRPIDTTLKLVEVIKEAVPMKYKLNHHPARKTFQAIRIEVNNELEVFRKSLMDALDILNIGLDYNDKIMNKLSEKNSKVNTDQKSVEETLNYLSIK